MFKGCERDGLSYRMLRLQQRRDELVCHLGSSLRISKFVEWSRTLLFSATVVYAEVMYVTLPFGCVFGDAGF